MASIIRITLVGLARRIRTWQARAHERDVCARFTERELKDIGLTRDRLYAELSKPVWRP
jgi:uncharacterized protein YjiS (DUF1127 family)